MLFCVICVKNNQNNAGCRYEIIICCEHHLLLILFDDNLEKLSRECFIGKKNIVTAELYDDLQDKV